MEGFSVGDSVNDFSASAAVGRDDSWAGSSVGFSVGSAVSAVGLAVGFRLGSGVGT